MKIGYLGPNGSYSNIVAASIAGNAELAPFPSISDVVEALKTGLVDEALIPGENSTGGSVSESIDFLNDGENLFIFEEYIMPIHHNLLVKPGTKLEDIKNVYSHKQALAQTRKFFSKNLPNVDIYESMSTSKGAQTVAQVGTNENAAIASKMCADEFGLEIIAENIEDFKHNTTRFWRLKRNNEELERDVDKVTISIVPPANVPGSLVSSLAPFSWRRLDLTKIESRPLRTRLGEYYFVLDISLNRDEQKFELMLNALDELASLNIDTKILGAYKIISLG
ncbi:MAG: prephenate dehydratase [Lactobacillales bacterium]|jgi:prephenate dehydratase|nr:prephenate dehydratase [Lactobacillales bacterium]